MFDALLELVYKDALLGLRKLVICSSQVPLAAKPLNHDTCCIEVALRGVRRAFALLLRCCC